MSAIILNWKNACRRIDAIDAQFSFLFFPRYLIKLNLILNLHKIISKKVR